MNSSILLFLQNIIMKNSSFSCLRSVNNQLHNKLSQQNQYQSYLKRVQNIVDRKLRRDTSSQFYMSFLHKCKDKSKNHKDTQQSAKILLENKHLLNKIMESRLKKHQEPSQSYHLNMYQKRYRQIEKINAENVKIAKRLTEQYSFLRKSFVTKQIPKTSKNQSPQKKSIYATWNYSPLKERKLPKLVLSPKKTEKQKTKQPTPEKQQ